METKKNKEDNLRLFYFLPDICEIYISEAFQRNYKKTVKVVIESLSDTPGRIVMYYPSKEILENFGFRYTDFFFEILEDHKNLIFRFAESPDEFVSLARVYCPRWGLSKYIHVLDGVERRYPKTSLHMFEYYPNDHIMFISKTIKDSEGVNSIKIVIEEDGRTLCMTLPFYLVIENDGFSDEEVSMWERRIQEGRDLISFYSKKPTHLGVKYDGTEEDRIEDAKEFSVSDLGHTVLVMCGYKLVVHDGGADEPVHVHVVHQDTSTNKYWLNDRKQFVFAEKEAKMPKAERKRIIDYLNTPSFGVADKVLSVYHEMGWSSELYVDPDAVIGIDSDDIDLVEF